jgi:iron complex transport system ATP-binding protein
MTAPSSQQPAALAAERIAWTIEKREILRGIGIDVAAGELVGLVGPNGSGKSSLLRTIYRVLKPDAGRITIGGEDVWKSSARRVAQRTASVLQEAAAEFDFSVEDVVFMGRTPHKGPLDRETALDRDIVGDALARVDMADFGNRRFATPSGGEKQRALIARAVAQQTQALILDEPTNHFDIRYQIEILELVRSLGLTTLAALHDLNLAAEYCDRLYLIDHGKVVASGRPEDVLRPELLRQVYGIGTEVIRHPRSGRPHLIFFPLRPPANARS